MVAWCSGYHVSLTRCRSWVRPPVRPTNSLLLLLQCKVSMAPAGTLLYGWCANSIFDGDKLLTTPNNERNEDLEMFETLGLTSRPAFMPYAAGGASSSGACQRSQMKHSNCSKQ